MKNNMNQRAYTASLSLALAATLLTAMAAQASGIQMTMSKVPADIQASTTATAPEGETPYTLPAHNKDDIRRAIDNQVDQLLSCYEALLEQKPKKQGKLVLSWAIDKKGGVNSPRVEKSEIDSKTMEKCALGAVKKWSFPEGIVTDDTEVYITYPFDFKLSQN
jgi:TonB family protein